MGTSVEECVGGRRKVLVGILKRKGYPLAEVMTPDGTTRFGFVGFVPDEKAPFRKIDWSVDQIRMSVIFQNPSAKKGEDSKIRIPKSLGLRYSNLNSLNGVLKDYIDKNYEPFNMYVNEFQVRRFGSQSDEHIDNRGIKWIKSAGEMKITAIDEKGVFASAGTILGIASIIRTRNNASFTWWETTLPALPRNEFISTASAHIVRIAAKPTAVQV